MPQPISGLCRTFEVPHLTLFAPARTMTTPEAQVESTLAVPRWLRLRKLALPEADQDTATTTKADKA